MLELIVSILFVSILFVMFLLYRRYLKIFKTTYYAISYTKRENDNTVIYYISFQWVHGYYRDGRNLTEIEIFLIPKKIKNLLGSSYPTQDEAYQAIKYLEAV